jgi:antitoxin ParD1/3/4
MTEEPTIRLARHFEVFVEDQIAAGKYASVSAVIEEALRMLERREAKMEALRQALIEGEESGPATPLDMEEIKRKARARAARAA